jgi:creatinine amidohydrolase/Fe(II)-dependent formamide hydrolase-like protein
MMSTPERAIAVPPVAAIEQHDPQLQAMTDAAEWKT